MAQGYDNWGCPELCRLGLVGGQATQSVHRTVVASVPCAALLPNRRRGGRVSVERQGRPECDLDLFHLLGRCHAHLLGHAALERALDQRRDGPPDTADAGSEERLRVLVLDDLQADEQGRGVVDRVGAEMISLRRGCGRVVTGL